MKTKRYSTSSSEDEVLIVFKQGKDPNGYHYLRQASCEQCEFCDEVFPNRYELFEHNITHMIIPLIKQITHQCKECLHHFISLDALESHMQKKHSELTVNPVLLTNIKINEKIPDILKSIVEKQLLVKCEDDITELVKDELSKNGINSKYNAKNSKMIDDAGNSKRDIKNYNGSLKSDIKTTHNDGNYEQNNKKIDNSSMKNDITMTYDENSEIGTKDRNIVKEEPFSPPFFKEIESSPTDDEKETIRNRLLFEEDVEDTLFRDLSNECHVNIETLCQEVSFDFEDSLSVSNSDDGIHNPENGINKHEEAIHNSENSMNNYEEVIDISDNSMNDYEEAIHNSKNNMNNYKEAIHVFDNSMNNYEDGIHNSKNNMKFFDDEMNDIEGKANFENVMVDYVDRTNNIEHGIKNFNLSNNYENGINNFKHENQSNNCAILNIYKNETDVIQYNAIHYDVLMTPGIWVCRFCGKEFANRFQLLQHKVEHLQVKKKQWSSPLCCLCDRYIAGNHYTLRNHKARKHPEYVDQDATFTTQYCPKCGLKYYNYSKHIKNYHEPYKCQICSRAFETLLQKNGHQCDQPIESQKPYALMKLCDLCFSFMKIYMQNRQNYEEIGTKSELGVRQTCNKCCKKFFSVKLVKRKSVRPMPVESRKMDVSHKASDVCAMASDGLRAPDLGRKASYLSHAGPNYDPKPSDIIKNKMKAKPMSNKDRLIKIQNRLKMLKMINKC